jgi:hypothetical protein
VITWDDVVAIAPELSVISTDGQTIILEYVNSALVPSEWHGEGSAFLRLARIYLAAHYGTITRQQGAGPAGPVTSESAGGLSRSYAVLFAPGGSSSMDTTPYGRSYNSLLERSPARAGRAL